MAERWYLEAFFHLGMQWFEATMPVLDFTAGLAFVENCRQVLLTYIRKCFSEFVKRPADIALGPDRRSQSQSFGIRETSCRALPGVAQISSCVSIYIVGD